MTILRRGDYQSSGEYTDEISDLCWRLKHLSIRAMDDPTEKRMKIIAIREMYRAIRELIAERKHRFQEDTGNLTQRDG